MQAMPTANIALGHGSVSHKVCKDFDPMNQRLSAECLMQSLWLASSEELEPTKERRD
jgi:hypothetical protein